MNVNVNKIEKENVNANVNVNENDIVQERHKQFGKKQSDSRFSTAMFLRNGSEYAYIKQFGRYSRIYSTLNYTILYDYTVLCTIIIHRIC